uniref:ATP-dependent DNA ligase family profile domain-containing protein n=1 Tax=Panagrolaimus sp. JU765 TaxID=591449 RepID=A0AC34QLZ7_9BILA
MSQLHKWTFDSFVERVQELSLAKKKFVESGFKTLLKEFDFDLIDPEAGQNLLKDVFLQPRNVYGSVFPEGFIRALFGDGELPCPEDKKRIKNEHIQSMSRRFKELCQDEPEPRPLFEEVCQAVQSVFKDVKADEAVSNLSIIRGLDVVSLEYVFRIITDLLPEKLFLAKDEIQKFFDDYAVEPKKRNTGILGFPQKPMLLVKMSTNILDYNDKIIGTCGERYLTETKFDGERIMVHKSRNIYKFYSRNGIDYSEKLGRDSSRHFAARIDSVFKDHVESCILDGELLVWDRQLGKLVGKNEKASDGKVYDVKNLLESKDDETCVVTRALCVFDVIHLNGYDLDDWTLSARLRQLHQMFKPEEMAHHTMFISNHIIADSRKVFLEYYNKAMTERLEGIVVK